MLIKKIEKLLIRIQIKTIKLLRKCLKLPPFRKTPVFDAYFETLYHHYVIELERVSRS